MAIQCPHCGTTLPRDDARFCNHCGNSVPVQTPLQQSLLEATPDNAASPQEPSSTTDQKEHHSGPREQIAQQPFSLPSQIPAQSEPPSWLRNLEHAQRDEQPSPEIEGKQPSLENRESLDLSSPPETPVPQETAPFEDLSTSITPHRSQFAGRELRVKVWEPEDAGSSSPPDVIEDLPTRPAISAVPPALNMAAANPVPLPQNQTPDQLELLDTAEITTIGQPQPPPATPLPVADQETRIERIPPLKENFALPSVSLASPASPAHQQLSMPSPTPFLGLGDAPSIPPLQERRPTAPPSLPPIQERQPAAPSAPTPQSRKSLYPLLALIILVPVLLVSALGIWIVQTQPFSVSPVTQPWQQFQNQKLGVSLLYPNGWQVQVDQAKSTIHFYDSSNTAQVTITVTDAANDNPAQYLSQQAKQLQMSGTKSAPSLTFAHTSWSQVQGATQQSGANYTTTLLAAVHNNHLFTITQLAPSSNYADQEKVNFSYMRDSWQFL